MRLREPRQTTAADERRFEIIDSATLVFSEVGFRSASMRKIAELSGLSTGAVSRIFRDKEELLTAVLEHRDEIDDERIQLDRHSGIQALRQLLGLVVLNATRRRIVELFVILSAEATAADHPAHDFFVERYERLRGGIERAYRRAATEGTLKPGIDPVRASIQLTALMDGLQVQWLLSDGALDMVAAFRAHLQNQVTEVL
ncbi:TetR/AcrR family transcriptional regulator [Gryllotalpicola ginsengisoli]|uniref:TetR/AcrR family transcriptional regulator n=1 Tax=Gryllotalpicola ginsengisoli TaxID=444608 RepID=UPI0003B5E7B1|nr:TetR family transcriptional regulator [Gryllotalpicola ginsengisoli]